MARILVPGVARVRLGGSNSVQNQVLVTDCYSGSPTPISSATLLALATAAQTLVNGATWNAGFPTNVTWTTVDVLDLGVAGSTSTALPATGVGTVVGAQDITACAAKVIKEIATGTGIRRAGAWFFPGVQEVDLALDTLQSSAITKFNGLATDLLTALAAVAGTTGNFVPCVVSTRFMGAARATGVQTPITGHACRTIVATQVGRLRGRKHKR